MNATLEALTAAQNLIRNPDHWTQDTFARDAQGQALNAIDPYAVCFCSYGALRRHLGGAQSQTYWWAGDLLDTAIKQIDPDFGVASFNDNHTHAEVMAVWDRARELASAEA